MTSISIAGSTVATYSYDGRNRRIVKVTTSMSETRHFYYTNSWQDIEERIGIATTADNQYVWGVRYVDELVCRDDATATTARRFYACQDANFNLVSISDSSGAVKERYGFDPYGNQTILNPTWSIITASAFSWSIGHQGLIHDVESGLLYNRNRYLQSSVGRFLNRNPWGFIQGRFNLYDVYRQNPPSYVEPYSAVRIPLPIDVPIMRMGPSPGPQYFIPPGSGWGLGYGPHLGNTGSTGSTGSWDWNHDLIPDNPADYPGYEPPPKYDHENNPDNNCRKPCGSYTRAYGQDLKDWQAFLDQYGRNKSGWGCAIWMAGYEIAQKTYNDRNLADDCHSLLGIDDGRHGPANNQTKVFRHNTYASMKVHCDAERRKVWLPSLSGPGVV